MGYWEDNRAACPLRHAAVLEAIEGTGTEAGERYRSYLLRHRTTEHGGAPCGGEEIVAHVLGEDLRYVWPASSVAAMPERLRRAFLRARRWLAAEGLVLARAWAGVSHRVHGEHGDLAALDRRDLAAFDARWDALVARLDG